MNHDRIQEAIHFLETEGLKLDIVFPDGSHRYYSTHCRHDRHVACNATSLAPDIPRQPAQCKTCEAPCRCPEPGCHMSDDERAVLCVLSSSGVSLDAVQISSHASVPPSRCNQALRQLRDRGLVEMHDRRRGDGEPRFRRSKGGRGSALG